MGMYSLYHVKWQAVLFMLNLQVLLLEECFYEFVYLNIIVFWDVPPCGLVSGYQRSGGTYYLHLQPHSGITQKTTKVLSSAEKTSHLI
jgi:hypothetical protein